MLQNVKIMIGPRVVDVYVYEQFMIIKNVHVIHCIDIFPTIEVSLMCLIIPWFLDFEQISSIKPIQLDNSYNYVPKATLSLGIDH
jgi:hypothetical protein